MFGTLHDGRGAFPEALEALAGFRAEGGTVVLVSNSALPAPRLVESLERRGIGHELFDGVVTSADVARDLLRREGVRAIMHVGTAEERVLFDDLPFDLVSTEAADIVVCTGWPAGPSDPDSGDLAPVLQTAASRGLTLVCTNPDRAVTAGSAVLRFAGLIADRYAEIGGRVVATGKPDGRIYHAALETTATARARASTPDRILAIGDGLDLDVMGAHAHGLDALWVSADPAHTPIPDAGAAIFRIAALRW